MLEAGNCPEDLRFFATRERTACSKIEKFATMISTELLCEAKAKERSLREGETMEEGKGAIYSVF